MRDLTSCLRPCISLDAKFCSSSESAEEEGGGDAQCKASENAKVESDWEDILLWPRFGFGGGLMSNDMRLFGDGVALVRADESTVSCDIRRLSVCSLIRPRLLSSTFVRSIEMASSSSLCLSWAMDSCSSSLVDRSVTICRFSCRRACFCAASSQAKRRSSRSLVAFSREIRSCVMMEANT